MKFLIAALFISALGGSVAQSALTAADNASNSAYNDGWGNGDNGGSGFQVWTLDGGNGGSGSFGRFIGSSTGLGGGSDINVSGESFGLYANGSGTAFSGAARSFSSGPLNVGQQFSFVVAVNFRNGNKGFDLQDINGNSIWNFNVGSDAYRVNGANVFGNTYHANTIFSFNFTQNSGTLDYTITRSGGLSGTVSSSSSISADSIYGIRFYNSGTGTGSENDFFFNSLSVVPEPANVALGIFGTLAVVGFGIQRLFSRRSL